MIICFFFSPFVDPKCKYKSLSKIRSNVTSLETQTLDSTGFLNKTIYFFLISGFWLSRSVAVRVEDYEDYYKKQKADSNCGFAEEFEVKHKLTIQEVYYTVNLR